MFILLTLRILLYNSVITFAKQLGYWSGTTEQPAAFSARVNSSPECQRSGAAPALSTLWQIFKPMRWRGKRRKTTHVMRTYLGVQCKGRNSGYLLERLACIWRSQPRTVILVLHNPRHSNAPRGTAGASAWLCIQCLVFVVWDKTKSEFMAVMQESDGKSFMDFLWESDR